MHLSLLIKGLIAGFLLATPVGPIGMLCIRRTLSEGKLHGLVSAFGGATADTIYGFIAASGLTIISNFLIKEQMWLRLTGGILLCIVGGRSLLSRESKDISVKSSPSYIGSYLSALLLTFANPVPILLFAAVFTSLGLAGMGVHHLYIALVVAGVFLGASAWGVILSITAGTFREKLDYSKLRWVHQISGIVIILLGLFALLSIEL